MAHEHLEIEQMLEQIESKDISSADAYRILKAWKKKQQPKNQVHYFQSIWRISEKLTSAGSLSGNILLLDQDDAHYRDLVKRYKDQPSVSLVFVKLGTRFEKTAEGHFQIRADSAEDNKQLIQSLEQSGLIPQQIVHLSSEPAVMPLFHLLKALSGSKNNRLGRMIIAYKKQNSEETLSIHGAVSGYGNSLSFMFPHLQNVTAIEFPTDVNRNELLKLLQLELEAKVLQASEEIRYINSQRFEKHYEPLQPPPSTGSLLKKKGVYLITGGVGGLGSLFCEYLAAKYQANLILTGRSPLDENKSGTLRRVAELGGEAIYLQGDVGQLQDMKHIMAEAKSKFGVIDGILHAAGSTNEEMMIDKPTEEFTRMLQAKVGGTQALDEVTKEERLDFFVLFSSTSSVLGDFGQCDYAIGNKYQDLFAEWRTQQVESGQRYGRTLAINWPLWKEGGMHFNEGGGKGESTYLLTSGLSYLEKEAGLEAFEQLLQSGANQAVVLVGQADKISQIFSQTPAIPKDLIRRYEDDPLPRQVAHHASDASLPVRMRIQNDFLSMITKLLKIPESKLSTTLGFGEYGFDSITLKTLSIEISQKYGIVMTPTVFFTHDTIVGLIDYLLVQYPDEMEKHYRSEERMLKEPGHSAQGTPIGPPMESSEKKIRQRYIQPANEKVDKEPVAVIGMSGRYPGSKDISELWTQLVVGKHLISEIPEERWDWREYYSEDVTEPNKTNSKWGGFIQDVDKFDAGFFHISPREAELMDPQQRIFLETVWKTIEDAGYKASDLSGTKTGVFVGAQFNDYQQLVGQLDDAKAQVGTGNAHAIISNRVSYVFNFRGSSESIDTACSSSAVAIHRAVKSIQSGENTMAIAGGVSIMLLPYPYLYASKMGIMAQDGKCKTFDRNANGYVRGEGIGALLLKPLSKAIEDGDHIYAVIKGTAENHGGKAQSLTAPNAEAQTDVVSAAYRDAGIDPGTVTYIEAHGTGTELGDPIEVDALKKAFRPKAGSSGTSKQHYCGLGSVKTHIGHLEPAAGIVGMTKVILSLKHKTIPGILHFNELNPYIDLKQSPFYIVDQTKSWDCLQDDAGAIIPRRAGVSSFGFGGSNVHMVLEEFENTIPREIVDNEPTIFVLSALSEERLRDYAQQFAAFVRNEDLQQSSLKQIVYTLQNGREAMKYRLAIIVNNREQLVDSLMTYVNGERAKGNNIFQGDGKEHKDFQNMVNSLEEGNTFLKLLIQNKRWSQIAQLWVSGIEMDWDDLYPEGKYTKVPLPTYPFSRERYWVPEVKKALPKGEQSKLSNHRLHPILGSNTSDFQSIKYSTFFTKKHEGYRIQQRSMLSHSNFLEMVCAASRLAGSDSIRSISNVVWDEPIPVPEEGMTTDLRLIKQHNSMRYEWSITEEGDNRRILAQGMLGRKVASGDNKKRDLNGLMSEMNYKIQSNEWLDTLREQGITFSEEARTVRQMHYSSNEALVELDLRASSTANQESIVLQPALIDGAIWSACVMLFMSKQISRLHYLVQEVREVIIGQPIPAKCYAYIQQSETHVPDESVQIVDVLILDEEGFTVLELRGIRLVAFEEAAYEGCFRIVRKEWVKSELPRDSSHAEEEKAIILFSEKNKHLADKLAREGSMISVYIGDQTMAYQQGQFSYCIDLSSPEAIKKAVVSIMEEHRDATGIIDLSDLDANEGDFKSKFILLQEMVREFYPHKIHILHLTKGVQAFDNEQVRMSGVEIAALVKTLHHEYKSITAKTIDIDVIADDFENEHIFEIFSREWSCMASGNGESEVCYRKGQRYVPVLTELNSSLTDSLDSIKMDSDKVYVVTGGTRGIGMQIAHHIVRKGAKRLVLMGQHALPPEDEWNHLLRTSKSDRRTVQKIKDIQSLKASGAHIEVCTGSITDKEHLTDYFETIRHVHGEIGGVFHCAGVISDENPAFIHKNLAELEAVCEPKIKGLQTLHQVFSQDALQFFVLFSSISAVVPSLGAGMSDYAIANSFMDAFAAYQHSAGNTYYTSVNWPSWKDVGMGETKSPLYHELGFCAHTLDEGLKMLDTVMGMKSATAVMPCKVDLGRFDSRILLQFRQGIGKMNQQKKAVSKPSNDLSELDTTQITGVLKTLFSEELKLPMDRLEEHSHFEQFGVDSILLAGIVRKIEVQLKIKMDPAAILEHSTLHSLSNYISETFQPGGMNFNQACGSGETGGDSKSIDHLACEKSVQTLGKEAHKRHLQHLFKGAGKRALSQYDSNKQQPDKVIRENELIAVIGMACHYPGAEDTQSFWRNLVSGTSSISEIPKTRWDPEQYYSPVYEKGKSISKWGGFIENMEYFDEKYFRFTEDEARHLDPLIRQFLEVSTQTIRNAGYEKDDLWNRKVGVFVGSRAGAFAPLLGELNKNSIIGIGQNFIAAHVSHFFNFRGPNLVVDTACSSSLVSIHMACQSLIMSESEIALAGGVDILFDENPYIMLSEGKALSPEGTCHTFDEKANGFVPGEGCGAVMLKTLDRALADGDQIYAVIEASAVNNDGHTMGVTTPNTDAQSDVINEALNKRGIDPASISYIEAHGTGTMIGDPIELRALDRVFRDSTEEKQFCAIGSVKTNIGHLLSAAGVASFMKVVLSLQHKQLPPTLNCETPNPRFRFEQSPFYPITELQEWKTRGDIRRAGISSFGFGGTNAHVIVTEAEPNLPSGYTPMRKPLPPVQFDRKYYWMRGKGRNSGNHSKPQQVDPVPTDQLLHIDIGIANQSIFQFSE